jgi:hypothetical protein
MRDKKRTKESHLQRRGRSFLFFSISVSLSRSYFVELNWSVSSSAREQEAASLLSLDFASRFAFSFLFLLRFTSFPFSHLRMDCQLSDYIEEPYDVPIDPQLLQQDANSPPSPQASALNWPPSSSTATPAAAPPTTTSQVVSAQSRAKKSWSSSEDARLVALVGELGTKKWGAVDARLVTDGGTRGATAVEAHYKTLKSRADAQGRSSRFSLSSSSHLPLNVSSSRSPDWLRSPYALHSRRRPQDPRSVDSHEGEGRLAGGRSLEHRLGDARCAVLAPRWCRSHEAIESYQAQDEAE